VLLQSVEKIKVFLYIGQVLKISMNIAI